MFKRVALISNCLRRDVGVSVLSVRNYEIPKELESVGTDTDPSFFKMVEYFYHYAVKVAEPSLEEYLKRHTYMSEKKRKQRVSGILKVLLSTYIHVLCSVRRVRAYSSFPNLFR